MLNFNIQHFFSMISKKYLSYFFHVLLWAFYSFMPVLYALQRLSYDPSFASKSTFNHPIFWIFVSLSSITLFYLNAFYLIPNFYKKKKPLTYALYLTILIFSFILIRMAIRTWITSPENKELSYYFYFNALLPYLTIFALSTSYYFFLDYQNEQKIKSEILNEQLKSELSFLRSQISPHFMFNLMNSMVSLARKKSELLEPMLIKMSELLRYMLYEKDGNRISIEKEYNYISSYIDLQKLRFGKKLNVTFNSKLNDTEITIEPMLLIPFVENAFKHGTGIISNPMIDIKLETDENLLTFSVINKLSNDSFESKDKSSGIGLTNVKRRLLLLYPHQHTLRIEKTDTEYIVELNITNK